MNNISCSRGWLLDTQEGTEELHRRPFHVVTPLEDRHVLVQVHLIDPPGTGAGSSADPSTGPPAYWPSPNISPFCGHIAQCLDRTDVLLVLPEVFKALGSHFRVANRVVNVLVTEVILDSPGIVPLRGEK